MSEGRIYEAGFTDGAALVAEFVRRFNRTPTAEEVRFAAARMPGRARVSLIEGGVAAALEALHREWVDGPFTATP